MGLVAFMVKGMRLSFNVFCATRKYSQFIKKKRSCFFRYFIALLLVFYKFFEPIKHFTWQMGSRICGGFIGHHCEHRGFPLDHETTAVGLRLSFPVSCQTLFIALVFQRKKGVTQSEP